MWVAFSSGCNGPPKLRTNSACWVEEEVDVGNKDGGGPRNTVPATGEKPAIPGGSDGGVNFDDIFQVLVSAMTSKSGYW